jgi:hypothetical protein
MVQSAMTLRMPMVMPDGPGAAFEPQGVISTAYAARLPCR